MHKYGGEELHTKSSKLHRHHHFKKKCWIFFLMYVTESHYYLHRKKIMVMVWLGLCSLAATQILLQICKSQKLLLHHHHPLLKIEQDRQKSANWVSCKLACLCETHNLRRKHKTKFPNSSKTTPLLNINHHLGYCCKSVTMAWKSFESLYNRRRILFAAAAHHHHHHHQHHQTAATFSPPNSLHKFEQLLNFFTQYSSTNRKDTKFPNQKRLHHHHNNNRKQKKRTQLGASSSSSYPQNNHHKIPNKCIKSHQTHHIHQTINMENFLDHSWMSQTAFHGLHNNGLSTKSERVK